jgi:hypothetical protein
MESLREVGLYYSPFSLVSGLKQQQILQAVFEEQSLSIDPLPLAGSARVLFRYSRGLVPCLGRAPESVAEFLCTRF